MDPVRAVLGADHALARPGRGADRRSPTDRQELVASVSAVLFGLVGIGVAWALYFAKTATVPKPWPILEKKFYWDEAYDLVFYRPAVALALALGRFVERPLIAGSIGEVDARLRLRLA